MTPNKLLVVIADDEPLPRKSLHRLLSARTDVEIVGEAEHGAEAQSMIESMQPDIAILDIRMPERDGIEIAMAVLEQVASPPVFIFVTAFDEYAVRAFDLHAVDYLLKPIDAAQLDRALTRAAARLAAQSADTDINTGAPLDPALRALLETLQAERSLPERFAVRDIKGGTYWVKASDIDWVDAQANYVRLHVKGQQHLIRDTMKAFVQKLPPSRYVRIHRSTIVNVDFIQRVDPHLHGEHIVTLRDGTRLRTSRSHGGALDRLMR